ncbi:TadE/TadG family type IV pilus assembly protein [Paenibacillus cremeus]|uniref:Pilus assembly protein n=1 Tax=Paenibacillus cremeus TaxID=2163881 RepID=A0A559KDA8_9BACL|nr:TadE family protein [Paenibacillus cremeus]TVY10117.1 pilus assembly protein [Paenibacillus cremeus]
MTTSIPVQWRRFIRSSSGQFAVEAALTMPVIFIATISFIFFVLYGYYQSSLVHAAASASERTAFVWDNSKKDLMTGEVTEGANDGLYWRLTNDNVSNVLSFILPTGVVKVMLPLQSSQVHGEKTADPAGKLVKTAVTFPTQWRGELRYENGGLLRRVGASLEQAFNAPSYARILWNKSDAAANAGSYVTDPVEMIWLTDLTRTFISEIQGRIKPKDAADVLVEPRKSLEEPVRINSHAQAADYLRVLVGGTAQVVQVSPDRKREIDAMDAGMVAHQAYYTFNETNLREEQMPKDAELLKQGTKVRGVVWHFFKLSKQDKVKLSQGLKQELERNGIVVVLHE